MVPWGRPRRDDRLSVTAIWYLLRAGDPWRDPPACFELGARFTRVGADGVPLVSGRSCWRSWAATARANCRASRLLKKPIERATRPGLDCRSGMRGEKQSQVNVTFLITVETMIPADHPIRTVKRLLNAVLAQMDTHFDEIYATNGRPEIAEVVWLAKHSGWVSDQHFSVDATLIEAWASLKRFKPKKDDRGDRSDGNGWADFKGEKRRNDTHESTTDREAKLVCKGDGRETKLAFAGHAARKTATGCASCSRLKWPRTVTPKRGTTDR